jgi:hypothetical protein
MASLLGQLPTRTRLHIRQQTEQKLTGRPTRLHPRETASYTRERRVELFYPGIGVYDGASRSRARRWWPSGRIHPDKATADAIEIARRLGRRLVICGPVQDETYYTERVATHVDGDSVRYLGNVGGPDRAGVLGRAAALLHPQVAAVARRRFSADRMVDEYLDVYQHLLATPTQHR